MSQTALILLQRVEHLGQMGEVVHVKPGYARNFLLPQGKAIRANATNRARFENERVQLEAQNIKKREEAERLSERMHGLSVTIIRQAGDSGSLYGSVTTRDVANAATEAGLTVGRQQIILPHPIKMLGLTEARVALHPEVSIPLTVNVARSAEEAERQARGEAVSQEEEDDNILGDLHAENAAEEAADAAGEEAAEAV
ncbi:50S ribosomal protein L9 [Gluconobacter wancherniae]|uniref:Large ribosomal subunit protein bL9 n=1 Tax=Gluconobacter wancherniae NBRC 103581 TaxID=656744 RepID=A0A511B429_9PROT|nr:50S ribosomal protein L9 [Gluconobacter wancherniae]MBF0853887.1 50S ribosomal protein L9 [Gluconobacter wancherniae]MBS1062273.1 50S ribosomal protein L9 [Gluconobacter wancherniae]MBS1089147.1 50S ribosomal protein L9 [Gluconobacter wancherniae]MBS1094315.1 50S ribosomal protein L9 [Gluconobacter wancherniae]MBS1094596.1 50S ribosomal protein L9 [Gluconobacter wancherniae]